MSLLDDLQHLDISAVVSARGGISASVSTDGVQAVIDGGAVTSALGDVGKAIDTALAALDDPSKLMDPLLAAFRDLLKSLAGHDLPVSDLTKGIAEGVGILATLLQGLADDPLAAGGALGRALPDALNGVAHAASGFNVLGGGDGLGRITALVAQVEAGGLSAEAIADLALDALAPFPRTALNGMRGAVGALLAAAGTIELPTTRTAGLAARLDAVAAAALTGDASAVTRALADLDRVRAQTLDVVRADMAALTGALDRLPVADIAGALTGAGNALAGAQSGILELLDQWRRDIASAKALVEAFDSAEAIAAFEGFLDQVEAFVREQLEAPVDAAASLVATTVHDLFGHIPLRAVRDTIRAALDAAAQAITDAHLDAPAETVRKILGDVRDAVAVADIGAQVRAALEDVSATLHAALDGVIAAINAVKTAIEAVAGEAAEVLGRAVDAVHAFQDAVTVVTTTVDTLDLDAAVEEVIEKVRRIREAVEGVVSEVPLPEPVRPVVTQLADQLEALNFSGALADVPVFQPMLAAVGELKLSDTLHTTVHDGLTALKEAVEHVIPASLVEGIQTEIQNALDVIAGFDPAALLSGVTEQINALADTVEGVDLVGVGAAAHAPFQEVLDGWDRLRPSVLMAPVGEAYQSLLSNIALPGSPEEAAGSAAEKMSGPGAQSAQAAAAPLAGAIPGAAPAPPGGNPAPSGPPNADAAGLKPGDVIRLFGYIPGKLREALAALEAGPAGQVLAAVDHLVGDLARDLRRTAAVLAEVETRLDAGIDALAKPLGPAQIRAQLALAAFPGDGLDLEAALTGVNGCAPVAVRAELRVRATETRARVGGVATRHAALSTRLLAIADGLDRCPLAQLAGGVDALLAALDPEPLAVEVDEFVYALAAKLPEFVDAVGDELVRLGQRFSAMTGAFNPVALGRRIIDAALSALEEELSVLDPRTLAAELDEIHQAVATALSAYDPATIAAELAEVQQEIVTVLRGLDPAAMLGDLTGLTDLIAKAAQALPTQLLTDLPAELTELDEAFAAIDFDALLASITALAPDVLAAFGKALDGIKTEIVALLDSLRYASGQIEAHASVEVHA